MYVTMCTRSFMPAPTLFKCYDWLATGCYARLNNTAACNYGRTAGVCGRSAGDKAEDDAGRLCILLGKV